MRGLYATITRLRDEKGKIESQQYAISRERDTAVRPVYAAIRDLFRNLPQGLQHFSADWLGHPETTYLHIQVSGPQGNITYHQQLTLTRIGFVERDGERFAVDLDTGTDLGLVNAFSFRANWSAEPDWMKYNNHPDYRRVWQKLPLCANDRSGDTLLVLTGPLLVHPAIARMAKFAASVLAGGQAETAPLNRIDREQAKLRAAVEAIRERVYDAVDKHVGLVDLQTREAELARLIHSMDWTFQEADRPDARSYDQRDRILAGLHRLDLDEATALFIANNRIYWTYLGSYFQHHPALKKMAA